MNLSVSFDPSNPDDVNAAIAALHKFINMEQRAATFTPVQLPAVALDKLDDPSVGAESKAEPAKRTRKPKEDAVVPMGESNPVSKSPDTSATSTEPSETAPAATAVSKDQVTDALRQYMAKHGPDKAVELLTKYGAQRVSELAADKYAEFVKECV